MLLVLVRHGETEWNKEGHYQGRADSALTNKGLEHAQRVADYLKNRKIDIIYSSPIHRAHKTAKIIAANHNCGILVDPLLMEIDYGIFEGKNLKEIAVEFPKEIAKKKADRYNYSHPNGEPYREMNEKRIMPFIDKAIKPLIGTDKTVVVVSHSGPGRMISGDLLDLNGSEIMKMWQPNDCIYFVEFKGTKPALSYLRLKSGEQGNGYLLFNAETSSKYMPRD